MIIQETQLNNALNQIVPVLESGALTGFRVIDAKGNTVLVLVRLNAKGAFIPLGLKGFAAPAEVENTPNTEAVNFVTEYLSQSQEILGMFDGIFSLVETARDENIQTVEGRQRIHEVLDQVLCVKNEAEQKYQALDDFIQDRGHETGGWL